MMRFLTGAGGLGGRYDLPLIILLMTILCVMILPLPTQVMDMLLAVNLTLAVMVLMVAVYLKRPLEFSTFPSIILLLTAFRIALSVASTRLILLNADAGEIIETFGNFVVQGNVVVGVVIFLIITTVQFLVVTKGAERIAEVSARFTLDAMPGKQMSIEADIRNGDLGKDAGRRKRDDLSQESQFFGAMDGAMKFVKGDAIAGLIIILINLIGGISIGVAQKGMSFGEAAQVYSLLTVGDGLVAQIPALFIALCAGAVVTRVTSDTSSDLGTDIVHQMIANRRSIWAAAAIVAIIGFLPGFPTSMFLALSAGLGAVAFISGRRALKRDGETELTEGVDDALQHLALPGDRLRMRVSPEDMDGFDWAGFVSVRDEAAAAFEMRHGYPLAVVGVTPDTTLGVGRFRVEFDEVPVAYITATPKSLFCWGDERIISLATGISSPGAATLPYGEGVWADAVHAEDLADADVPFYSVEEALHRACRHGVLTNMDELVTTETINAWLNNASETERTQIAAICGHIDIELLIEVLRRLMVESVPLVPRYAVFNSIFDWCQRETNPVLLTEYTRQGLRRQICNVIASGENEVATYLVDTRLDHAIREAVEATDVGGYLALDASASAAIIETFTAIHNRAAHVPKKPAIVAANDVRRFLRKFLVRNNILLPVISQQELCAEFSYRPLGIARLKPGTTPIAPPN